MPIEIQPLIDERNSIEARLKALHDARDETRRRVLEESGDAAVQSGEELIVTLASIAELTAAGENIHEQIGETYTALAVEYLEEVAHETENLKKIKKFEAAGVYGVGGGGVVKNQELKLDKLRQKLKDDPELSRWVDNVLDSANTEGDHIMSVRAEMRDILATVKSSLLMNHTNTFTPGAMRAAFDIPASFVNDLPQNVVGVNLAARDRSIKIDQAQIAVIVYLYRHEGKVGKKLRTQLLEIARDEMDSIVDEPVAA